MQTYQNTLLDLAKAGVYEIKVLEPCILYLGGVYRLYHIQEGTHYIHNPLPNNSIFVSKPIVVEGTYLGHVETADKLELPVIKSIDKDYITAENARLEGTVKNMSLVLKSPLSPKPSTKFISAFSTIESKLSVNGMTHQFTGSVLIPVITASTKLEIYWDLVDYQYSLIEFYNGTIQLQGESTI